MLQGFAILIGTCKIIPPSPKAAILLLMWFWGAVPGVSYEEYETQYQAMAGQEQTAIVEKCFGAWNATPVRDSN